jgi:phytoene/squalene synthetase
MKIERMGPQVEMFLEIFNSIDFEKIKDHPNILIAANFWDEERYQAAKTCYKFMRAIDDLIDDHKARNKRISEDEREIFVGHVNDWIHSLAQEGNVDPMKKELADTISRFKIPLWPLEAFAKSMIYDIHFDGFPTMKAFLEYSGGASVAPASIFVHLCGLNKVNNEYYPNKFDLKSTAAPCAIFSYLVHIIRDFQKDTNHHLCYFADDLLKKHGLSREELRNIAGGSNSSEGFRRLIKEYYESSGEYRDKTLDMIRQIRPSLGPNYRLSLDIIFNLYLLVYERIDWQKGNFSMAELNPTPAETRQRVYETILQFRE